MKKTTIIGLTICLIMLACNSNPSMNKSVNQTETKLELQNTFYKKMKGTIGDIAITMDLLKTDSTLTGSYYYNNVGIPLAINGTITTEGKIEMSEINKIELSPIKDDYEDSGNFSGAFEGNNIIKGTWVNTKTKKSLPFQLTEITDSVTSITFETLHNENCANANNDIKNATEEADTICTTLDISLIKILTPYPASTNLINQSIVKNICDFSQGNKKGNSIKDLLNSINNVAEDEGYELIIGSDLVTNDNNILCIEIWDYYMGHHTAHPTSQSILCNYDVRTGKTITLNDILLPNFKNKLNQIGEQIFIRTNGKEGWDFKEGMFKLNDNFAITTGGIKFSFNQYEIGGYVSGAPDVFIPYKDINDLINPNGQIGQWRKN